jgi:acyl-[acyl-carrier-protein]-phospholipid O-acyltransferase/long-chain-fatty-acid--[acyl-carrier-protein] ligase
MGRLLPGVAARIEPVPGINEGGRCYLKGPNVMLGYLRADKPGVVQPPEDGWYDTGDIVHIDEYGFMTIEGRARRFAKVGGEMISLAALEEELELLWPDIRHAVVAVQDERRGEGLLVITEKQNAARDELFAHMKERGYADVSIPKKIIVGPELPLLGSGKTNYPALEEFIAQAEKS